MRHVLSRQSIFWNASFRGRSLASVAPRRSLLVWVLGGPGSGKGTQCELIRDEIDAEHLVPGEMLRAEAKKRTEAGLEIDRILKLGRIIPASVTVPLLATRIGESRKKVVLVDGFPRNMDNVETFRQMIKRDCDLLLFYECDEEELFRRLMKRGETSGRNDDNSETIRLRLETFRNQTLPVINMYREEGKVVDIDGNKPVSDVLLSTRSILSRLLATGRDVA